MRFLTVDIETSNTFDEAGSSDPADLEISVVCVHDSQTGQVEAYLNEELSKLWPVILEADGLIGWNSAHFDLPILARRYPGSFDSKRSVDLMREMQRVIGRRIKLDHVAQATLGKGKSADGLQALVWWRNGEKQKVIDYCKQDVLVTRELFDYALKNGELKYPTNGGVETAKLDTSEWLTKPQAQVGSTAGLFG